MITLINESKEISIEELYVKCFKIALISNDLSPNKVAERFVKIVNSAIIEDHTNSNSE